MAFPNPKVGACRSYVIHSFESIASLAVGESLVVGWYLHGARVDSR